MGEDELGKLFIGAVDKDTTQDEFQNYFAKYGELADCVLMKDPDTPRNRGFGFVKFVDTATADLVMNSSDVVLNGKKLDPKKCTPRGTTKPKSESSSKSSAEADTPHKIFVGGLPQGVTEEEITKCFNQFGQVSAVKLAREDETNRTRGFGFVSFMLARSAQEACKEHFVECGGKQVECKPAEVRGNRMKTDDKPSQGANNWQRGQGGPAGAGGFGGPGGATPFGYGSGGWGGPQMGNFGPGFSPYGGGFGGFGGNYGGGFGGPTSGYGGGYGAQNGGFGGNQGGSYGGGQYGRGGGGFGGNQGYGGGYGGGSTNQGAGGASAGGGGGAGGGPGGNTGNFRGGYGSEMSNGMGGGYGGGGGGSGAGGGNFGPSSSGPSGAQEMYGSGGPMQGSYGQQRMGNAQQFHPYRRI